MIDLLVAGSALEIFHHLFYQSLHGKAVQKMDGSQWSVEGLSEGQEWNLQYGTELASLAGAFFVGAVRVAYNQYIWARVKDTSMSIGGLDIMFDALNDIFSLLSIKVFSSEARMGYVLAVIAWYVDLLDDATISPLQSRHCTNNLRLLPLSASITPATLTVGSSTTFGKLDLNTSRIPVPIIDILRVSPLYLEANSNYETDYPSYDNGVTSYLSMIMSSAASNAMILPMRAVMPDINYNLTFWPFFQPNPESNHTGG